MAGAIRQGDYTTGHGPWGSQTVVVGSPNVFVNGRPASRVGDTVSTHCAVIGLSTICHSGSTISSGSHNVFVNGRPKARNGDGVSCGGSVMGGSGNVIVN